MKLLCRLIKKSAAVLNLRWIGMPSEIVLFIQAAEYL